MGGILLSLVLLVLGVLSVISPGTTWYLSRGWQFRDAEPSDAALISIRVAGVIEILASFFILFTI